jgi:hypothetical protein
MQGVGFEPTKGKARLIYSQVHLTALAPLLNLMSGRRKPNAIKNRMLDVHFRAHFHCEVIVK